MVKKFLRLGFGSWLKRRREGTYLRYYIENPEDTRNILARWLDLATALLLFWILVFLSLLQLTQPAQAVFLSLGLLILSVVVVDAIKRRQLQKKLYKTRLELARQSYLEKIKSMSPKAFKNFTLSLLQQCGAEIQPEGPVLACRIKNTKAQLIFFQEDETGPAKVREIADRLTEKKFKAGIIISKDKLSPETTYLLERYRSVSYIEALDAGRLAVLAAALELKSTKQSLADNLKQLKKQRQDKQQVIPRQALVGSRKKTLGFALTGIFLLAAAMYAETFALSFLYIFFAVVNIFLSIASYSVERRRTRRLLVEP